MTDPTPKESVKRIIILSDGTGNSAASFWRTNVRRTYEALDLSRRDQVAFYDDGVGTSSFKPLAILGGAFGYGLKRNVINTYAFVCRNYRGPEGEVPADDIYAFGFSRGAFTIRVVIGLILNQGLVQAETERERLRLATLAYRAYRAKRFHTKWRIEDRLRRMRTNVMWWLSSAVEYDDAKNVKVAEIKFIGVWDTVAAYGLPVDEMTRGVSDWIWPLALPNHEFDDRIKKGRLSRT